MTEKLVKSTPKLHKTKVFFLRKLLTMKDLCGFKKIVGRFSQIADNQFIETIAIKKPWCNSFVLV